VTTPLPGPPPNWPGQPPFGPAGYPPAYPVSYPPPGYVAYPPPGYGGYPPPGYPPPASPFGSRWQPGVIPLRALTLSEIFGGALGYVRANPKATLGLTAATVTVTSTLALLLQFAAPSGDDKVGLVVGTLVSATAPALAMIVLSGMLTVVVARAVIGSTITIGAAWQRVRGRLAALIGLGVLQVTAVALLIGGAVLTIVGVARAANGAVAALIGVPLVLFLIAALAYLFTILAFAPVAIVLERKPILAAIERSFALVRHRFWRILGIRVLAGVITSILSMLVSLPFSIFGQVFSLGTTGPTILGALFTTAGEAVGQIITAPFSAGVVVLLYVDARIRSEAFDATLRSGATRGPAAAAFTDDLWLTPGR